MSKNKDTLVQLGLEMQIAFEQQFSYPLQDWTNLRSLNLDDVSGWYQLHDDVVKLSSLQEDWAAFIDTFNQGLYPEIFNDKKIQHSVNERQKFISKEKADLEVLLEKKNKTLNSPNFKNKTNPKKELKAQKTHFSPKVESKKEQHKPETNTRISASFPLDSTQKLSEKSDAFSTANPPLGLKDLAKLLHQEQLTGKAQTKNIFLKKQTKSSLQALSNIKKKPLDEETIPFDKPLSNTEKKTSIEEKKAKDVFSKTKGFKALSQWLNTKSNPQEQINDSIKQSSTSFFEEEGRPSIDELENKHFSSSFNQNNEIETKSNEIFYKKNNQNNLSKKSKDVENRTSDAFFIKNQEKKRTGTPENIDIKSDLDHINEPKAQMEQEDIDDIIDALAKHIQQEYKRFYG